MLNAVLNRKITLGSRDGASSVGTSTSRSSSDLTTTTPTRTISEAIASDEYGIYIVPFQQGYGIIISDGVSTWNIRMGSNDTVLDRLHKFFTEYYKYSLLPQQNENGTYARQETYGPRNGYNSRYANGYKAATDEADYQVALSNKKLLTLTNILANGNPIYKYFTVPYGYYYIGKDVDTAPYVSIDNSKDGISTGENVDLNLRAKEYKEWVDGNNDNNKTTTNQAQAQEDNTMLYILLGIASLVAIKMLKN